jgi:hypothetical protein
MNSKSFQQKRRPTMKLQFAFILMSMFMAINIHTQTVDFDKDEPGKPPKGFTTALTGGGALGVWVIQRESSAPSQPNVLAQTDMGVTDYRFPLCVYDGFIGKDVDLSVKFKPVKGEVDQAAGLAWRYKDKDNYYIVRANALENNVVLYKVEKGKRTDLPLVGKGRAYGAKVKVPSGEWGTLRVVVNGNLFEVFLNGTKLYEVEDATFAESGKVGLWTKADSYTLFDDLKINTNK